MKKNILQSIVCLKKEPCLKIRWDITKPCLKVRWDITKPCLKVRWDITNKSKRGSRHTARAAKVLRWRIEQLQKRLIKKITLSS